MRQWRVALAVGLLTFGAIARGEDAPATQPSEGGAKLGAVSIDTSKKQVRVVCETLNPQMPLEFFCVVNGGQEHESVLRTGARPSVIHFGLLALGLKAGAPARFDQANNLWHPPTGSPLKIECEFVKNGKTVTVPAQRMMRSVKTHQEMPEITWVFDGSRMMPDGQYAADLTGYVVSIVNFDLTMIDVPELVSNANETLEWEYNPDVCPVKGTPVTMIIEPAPENAATRPEEDKPGGKFNPGPGLGGGGR